MSVLGNICYIGTSVVSVSLLCMVRVMGMEVTSCLHGPYAIAMRVFGAC